MRKAIAWLLGMLLILVCLPAVAEIYVFDEIYASMEVPDSYIVLTPKNLDSYAGWLEARGGSMQETQDDFAKRGVLLQAWTEENDTCFELRIRKDEQTQLTFDINEQAASWRALDG